MTSPLPKRLIEVDLPIKRISAHARREKSIRHGHISTLHILWARRPLAACRAVLCAALWPDPADPLCPESFRRTARLWMQRWVKDHLKSLGSESLERFVSYQNNPSKLENNEELRYALLDFIADFANWDNSHSKEFLDTSRALTQSAHESLGGAIGTKPLVADPFSGGGSIPVEALRIGADVFASDLNPIAVLINKVVLEYIPKYGQRLADQVRKSGDWINNEARKELSDFYPKGADGGTPVAYLWARTIQCEGPSCGAEVPLLRSLWLAKKQNRSVALHLLPNAKERRVDFEIICKTREGWIEQSNSERKIENPRFEGTVKRGSATCPCCGYTTGLPSVKVQLQHKHGGTDSARIVAIVSTDPISNEVTFRLPTEKDRIATRKAAEELEKRSSKQTGLLSLVPNEPTTQYHVFVNRGPLYGMVKWQDYFTPRQSLALTTLARLIQSAGQAIRAQEGDEFSLAVETCLAFAMDKCADYSNSCATWMPRGTVGHLFARQAIPMTWDFPEANPVSDFHCAWDKTYEWPALVCEDLTKANLQVGQSTLASATAQVLPDDSANALITDPPYYYSVQYGDLSDFFYVWLRRSVGKRYGELFGTTETPKSDEIIVQSPGHEFALLALRTPTLQAFAAKGKHVDLNRNLKEAKEVWGAEWRDNLEGVLWLDRPKLYATPWNLIVLQPLVGHGLVEERLEMSELREPNISAIRDLGEARSLVRDLVKALQVPPSRIFSLSPVGLDFLDFMGFATSTDTVLSTEEVEAQVSGVILRS
jgi:adenine-specific DNA methylase